MDLRSMSDLLNDDLTDTRIPAPLINDENKLLEENAETKMKDIALVQDAIDENVDRIRMLEDHQRVIQDELSAVQRLLAARRTEETTERSHVDNDIAELRRIERLTIDMDKDLIKVTERRNRFETEIQQLHTQIANIIDEAIIEQDALEQFADAMKKRDDEMLCLTNYTRQDDARSKELIAQLERFSDKSSKLKRAVEEETIESSGLQVELDKMADTFRRSHAQRQQIIERWESILVQMQRKDQDIDVLAVELVQIKAEARAKERDLGEQKLFYEREQKNNKITEKLMDLASNKTIALKAKLQTSNETRDHFETEMFSLKTALTNVHNQLQRERAVVSELKNDLTLKRQELAKGKKYRAIVLDRKRTILNEKLTIEEKLVKLNKLADNEHKRQNDLNNQLKKLSEQLFASNNELTLLRTNEKKLEVNIQASILQIRHVKNQTNKFDQQALKQQELLYHQDFHIQAVDRRLNRMLGEKNSAKYTESDIKIRELQSQYAKKKNERDVLQAQIKIVNEELRITRRDLDRLTDEKIGLREKFLEFDLYTTLSEKMYTKFNDEKEDSLVEMNLLKIEMKRLKKNLQNSNTVTCSLEQQQIEIQRWIKERRMEVQANSYLLRVVLNDERAKKATISTELTTCIAKVGKLKNKYESLTVTMGTEYCHENNVLAQAQYVIKTAQTKEDLLEQGDQLEALITKAETELRALENTVQVLKWNNVHVKKNFEKLQESSSEICEMEKLEEHLRAVTDQMRLRRQLIKKNNDHADDHNDSMLGTDLISIEEQISQANMLNIDKRRIKTKLEDELEQYRIKIDRTNQLIKRFRQISRGQRTTDEIEQDELDVDVRVQRDANRKIQQQLLSLCLATGNNDVIDTFEKLSASQGCKIAVRSAITRAARTRKKQSNRSKKSESLQLSTTSDTDYVPNIVNVSIGDNATDDRSSTSTISDLKYSAKFAKKIV